MKLYYALAMQAMQILLMLTVFQATLKPRGTVRKRVIWMVSFFLVFLVLAWMKMTSPIGTARFQIAMILIYLIYIPYLALGFDERIWKKILVFLLATGAALVSEVVTLALFRVSGNVGILHLQNFASVSLAMTCMNGALAVLLILAFNRIIPKNIHIRHYLLFLLFPVSQLLIFLAVDFRSMGGDLNMFYQDPTAYFGYVIGIAADIGLLSLMIWDEKRERIRDENEELKRLCSLEELHFSEIERRETEFSKIRHDYINQLSAAVNLIRLGHADEAVQNLEAISGQVRAQGAKGRYCANHTVNAILIEKEEECRRRGIALDMELDVDEIPGISQIHLCSIFSNLLDNAIRASAECADEPKIRLHAAIRKTYMVVKTENPSLDPAGKKRTRRGYGQEILRDIAAQYEGDFRTEWKDGIYTAVMTVKIGSPEHPEPAV